MKIKNLFILGSSFLLAISLCGFINPTSKSSEVFVDTNEEISFPDFLSYFKKTELPYQMKLEDFKKYKNFQNSVKERLTTKAVPNLSQNQTQNILPRNKFIPETNSGLFSRMGPPIIHPVAYFYPNEKSVAVVYTAESRFQDNIHESIRFVVFDLEGNIVFPENEIKKGKKKKHDLRFGTSFELGHSSIENTTTFRINKEGQILKKTYSNIWKDDLKETPFFENELLSFKMITTENFQINKQGIAEKLQAIPVEARVSLD